VVQGRVRERSCERRIHVDRATLVNQLIVCETGRRIDILDRIEGSCITGSYRPGTASECSEGVCIMPHVELQEMMAETLSRRDPTLSVRVLLMK